ENPQINLSLKTENLIPEKFNLKSDIFFNSLDPSTLNINKKGYELLSNFDYLKAESSFSENPLDEYDYAGLILAQNFLFDFEKAFDTADKGLKLFNNSIAIANAVFATCIYSNSNFEKYYNLLENSLNNFKGDLCSLFFASIINKYSSNLNNSEKWEKKIFELKPDDSIYAILEAILALKQDNTVKAIEILNSSIQKSPYYADNYVFLTDLLIETGNFEEADSIISKLENLFPDFYKLFYIKSAYYYNVNSKEFKNKTAEYINKMIELNPGLFNKCKILNEEKVFLLKEIMNISLNIGSFEWIIEKIKNQNNFSEIMDKPSFFFNNFLLITSLLKGNTNDSKYFSNQVKNYTSELAGQNSLLPFYFINQLIDYDFIIEAQSQLDNIFSFFDLLDYQNQILTYELAVKLSLKNQDFTKAADYYEKLMNLTPQEKHILIEQIENLYLTDYVTNKNNSYEKLMDFYKRNNLSEKLNDIENRLPEKSYENKISEWILSDVEKIVHICRDYNVPVYFMNYFRVNYDFIKKNVENYDNVYFIDNYNHFNNTISKTYSNTDNLFFYDGHLTADGNRLKADYIVNNLQFNN
ncbi:MAG: tetratricopeptide repeat protein, partial [Candidatus Muiribacteriota bacterium]